MLVLEGPQGKLKSEALRKLAIKDVWFIDRISHLAGKDAVMEISGALLIEIAEMDALVKAASSTSKGFLTRPFDKIRPPYGPHTINLPRQWHLWRHDQSGGWRISERPDRLAPLLAGHLSKTGEGHYEALLNSDIGLERSTQRAYTSQTAELNFSNKSNGSSASLQILPLRPSASSCLLVSTESPTQLSTLTPKFNLAPGRGSPETAAPPTARPAARRLGFAGYVRRVCAGIGARHSMIKCLSRYWDTVTRV